MPQDLNYSVADQQHCEAASPGGKVMLTKKCVQFDMAQPPAMKMMRLRFREIVKNISIMVV
jgi:hypothetical protein